MPRTSARQLDREIAESLAKRPAKRWNSRKIARDHDVDEGIVRRIYAAIQTAKRQGLRGGHMADLIERNVGRRLRGGEYAVVRLAKEQLQYAPEGGYSGPQPTGAAKPPPRAEASDRRIQEAQRRADHAERIIKEVLERTGMWGSEEKNHAQLRQAADELDVAADQYEEAGATVTAGTLHERARLARSGYYRQLHTYHMTKKPPRRRSRPK
jgi:hypothetical protein